MIAAVTVGMAEHEREREVDQREPGLLGEQRELLDCVELRWFAGSERS